MNVYEIEISNVDLSPHNKQVLAPDFAEAFKKAMDILAGYQKEIPDAEITEITRLCTLTEV